MTQNQYTKALDSAGVSLWLDDLSRSRLESGDLKNLTQTLSISGVTTNPAIFANALSSDLYAEQLKELAAAGADASTAITKMTTDDVRTACDVMKPIYEASNGQDGRVSIEVDPRSAWDIDATVEEAKALFDKVGRENVMIKIPATKEGLSAISQVLAEGISVNVTLIFSLIRYREVLNAWLIGLEKARAAGKDLSRIHSVASFFVSRVDTEIDQRLEDSDLDSSRIAALRGRAGLANARLAYRIFEEIQDTERWRLLEANGAVLQRPLWASTGTKNPEYSDVLYVTELVAPNTVNTLPEATLRAVADHGEISERRIPEFYETDDELLDELGRLDIDYADVVDQLEQEGLTKFVDAWVELIETTQIRLNEAS